VDKDSAVEMECFAQSPKNNLGLSECTNHSAHLELMVRPRHSDLRGPAKVKLISYDVELSRDGWMKT
jgi:hypothetical protein